MKRSLTVASLLLSIGIAVGLAGAGEFPTKPIEFVVPFGAGGNSDVTARLFAQKGLELLGQPMVVVNKPGAGGALGLITVARSNPDGYAVALAGTNLAMGRAVNPNVGYDPVKDFAPVANLITQGVFLCVNASSKITTFAQYIEEAKKNPGKITFGSSGIGGSTHFAGEYLKRVVKIDITNVPIREGLVRNLLGGHVDSIFVNTPDIVEQVQAGKIRALVTTTLQRVPQLADVPTVAESGYPGFQVISWNGVAAPAKTPPAVVAKLSDFFKRGAEDPQLAAKLTAMGANPSYMNADEFGAWVKNEYEKWSKVANEANIRAE